MQSMLRIFALGIVLLIFLPAIGFAQGGQPPLHLDHLKCYMVKDPKMVKADVNLFSLQFDIDEDCKIIGKERFFCGGVDKTVVGEDPSDFPIFPDAHDRICYRIECPQKQGQNPVPEDVEVVDQFGKRTLTNFNPHYLCTPAFKPGETCETRTFCGGECTDENNNPGICRQLAPGVQDCLCVSDVPCEQRASCGSDCIVPDTVDVIGECRLVNDGGDCSCALPPDFPCEERASCGGECTGPNIPPGAVGICQDPAGTGNPIDCFCLPPLCTPECVDNQVCIDGQCCAPSFGICQIDPRCNPNNCPAPSFCNTDPSGTTACCIPPGPPNCD